MADAIAERSALPTGTVTFLFSDIEGSTERWERHRAAMKTAVAWHETLVQGAISGHGGHVFKTVGDAFCAAFHTVPDAIAAALDAQHALSKEDFSAVDGLKVRIALHTGLADERNGDYFGPTVNRVARLLSIGHGGQVLVSGAASDLAQGEMPPRATLRDLGAHRLKDLAHPEQVYQLLSPDLPADFPPLRSLESLPNNLPLQVTLFLGREKDVMDIERRLAKTRLLTLVGTGGVGKTRLSLQIGADVLDQYEDGVWLVELAPILDPDLIPGAMATIFGVGTRAGQSPLEALVHVLRSKRMLVILDNCEHIVAGAARTADALLHGCPHVRVIATSRQGLGIDGEVVLRVASLPVPERIEGLKAADAIGYGAIALFVERASAAVESFRLTDENAPTIAQICRRLDGIALAVELAASRIKVLTPVQLLAMLSERFRVLTGGKRTALPRQQTMRAAIDWSYDLLDENEELMFRRLAVFSGGCTLEAAREVCGDQTIGEWEVFELLSSLIDKSLVSSEASGAEQRYRLLESTRQYALEKLEQSGGLDGMQRRHAAHYVARVEHALTTWDNTPTFAWLESLQADYDNFRGVMDWGLIERHDVELGAKLTGMLARYWRDGPYATEGRQRITAATDQLDATLSPATKARLLWARGYISGSIQAWPAMLDFAKRALAIYEELGDRKGEAWCRLGIGESLHRMGRFDESLAQLDTTLVLMRELGEPRGLAYATASLARNHDFQGHSIVALSLYEEALAQARSLGDARAASTVINNIAENVFEFEHDAQRALDMAREVAEHYTRAMDKLSTTLNNNNMAAYLLALGRVDEAYARLAEAVKLARDGQAAVQLTYTLQHLAAVAAMRGHLERSARLLGYVDCRMTELGAVSEYTERQEREKVDAMLAGKFNESELAALRREGAALSEDQAVEEALRA
jgi:predicted ATPase/class 3 adenylate cyclase